MRAHAYSGDLEKALCAAATAHPLLRAVSSYRFVGYGDDCGEPPDIATGVRNLRRTTRAIEIALEAHGPLNEEFGRELLVGLFYKDAMNWRRVVSPLVALALAANSYRYEDTATGLSALSPSARMILATSYKFGVAAPIGSLVPLPCHFVYDAVPLPLGEWIEAMESLERGGYAAPAARVESLLPCRTVKELFLIASELEIPVKKSASKKTLVTEIANSFGGFGEMQIRVANAAGPPTDPFLVVTPVGNQSATESPNDPAAALLWQELNFRYMPSSHIQLGVSDSKLDKLRRGLSKTCDVKE